MKTNSSFSRRAFLARSAQATAAVTLAGSPLLAREQAAKTFTVKSDQVRGVALDVRGRIAIAADRSVLIHELDGRLVREIAVDQPVRAVAFDARGNLFVAFKDRVAQMDDAGRLAMLGSAFGTRQSALVSLAIADDGRLFAADSGERVVWRLDAGGRVLGKIQPGENGFTVPRAFFPIAWRDGRLLVADPGRHEVQTYSADGRLLAKWGGRSRELEGFGGCCNPVSFAALPDGTVVTAERGQTRVKRFDDRGRLQAVLAGPEQFAASAQAARAESDDLAGCAAGLLDVAASPTGRLVILDRTTREVRVLA